MASGDTKTESYLRAAAEGTRADLPADSCCNTKTQNLILGVANRIMDVEDEVERLENNPDVVDIVATYDDLRAYDTGTLTDKDIIRVLEDSTHNNNSTYYRWNATTNQFDFVGEISGGSSVNVVQTTGTSTTDVMSQDATTKMIYADSGANNLPTKITIGKGANNYASNGIVIGESALINSSAGIESIAIGHSTSVANKETICIGHQARSRGSYNTNIGYQAGYGGSSSANYNTYLGYASGEASNSNKYSVALGYASYFTRDGEVNIRAGDTTHGFNNTSYRVLGGVHDGQDAHDAVTVEQVNATIDAINAALSTSIPHIGA